MFLSATNPNETQISNKSQYAVKKNLLDVNLEKERRRSFMFNESTLDKGLSHWEEIKIKGKKIQRRSYHSSVFVGNQFYVFGGYDAHQGILQDFITVNLDEKLVDYQWEEVDVKSQFKPSQRCRHSAVVSNDIMYVYGGQTGSLNNTNELLSFNFKTGEWAQVIPEGSKELPPLDSHTAAIWKKEDGSESMIIVGGFIGGHVGEYSNAVYEYQFQQNKWTTLFKNKIVDDEQTKEQNVPQGRMSMGATIYQQSLFIFGGNEGNTKFNDMWRFDLPTRKWSLVKVEGGLTPEPRSGLSMINFQNLLIIFGGILDVTHEKNDIFVFNIDKSSWDVAEQSTKWVFQQQQQEEKNTKTPLIKKSQFSKTETGPKTISVKNSPRKQQKKNVIRLSVQKADSECLTQSSDVSCDTSAVDFHPSSSGKQIRFEKLLLPSVYQNDHLQTKSGKGGEDLTKGATHRPFKSTLEENHIRSKLLEKQRLLSEFNVTEEEAKTLRAPTPTTESIIKSLENLTIVPPNEKVEHILSNREATYSKSPTSEEKTKVGVKPVGRDGHTACIMGNKMYIFAGDRHKMSFNDIFTLNLNYFKKM